MPGEDLFPGRALPLPTASSTGSATWTIRFGPDEPPEPPPVRHAAGYRAFARFAADRGADVGGMTRDVPGLARFVHVHAEALADPVLAEAAAVFLGNALNAVHPTSTWQTAPKPSVGAGPYSFDVRQVIGALREDAAASVRLTALLADWDAEEARYDARRAQEDAVQARLEAIEPDPTPAFVPPPAPAVLDDEGRPYGTRWPDGPPEDAYSRTSHLERFAALHRTADALVAHLERWTDVAVHRTTNAEGERAADLLPARGAPVRLTWTGFPGIRLRAGLLWSESFPPCGCDACDDAGADQAAALTAAVLGVVAGGLLEERLGGDDPAWYAGLRVDGGWSAGGRPLPEQGDRLVEPDALPDGPWPAWPPRR